MSDWTRDEMMTVAAARLLWDRCVCFVGIGLPSAACNLARLTHAPEIVLIYESGTIGTRPTVLPLSIGDGELAETAACVIPLPEVFSYYLQAGRVDVGFLGAAQIDRHGNLNSTVDRCLRRARDAPAGCGRRAGDRRARPANVRDAQGHPPQLRGEARFLHQCGFPRGPRCAGVHDGSRRWPARSDHRLRAARTRSAERGTDVDGALPGRDGRRSPQRRRLAARGRRVGHDRSLRRACSNSIPCAPSTRAPARRTVAPYNLPA